MYVEDIKKDFYNVLCGNRILLLVHLDVDAVCACKILQALLKSDNIAYTVVGVGGPQELRSAYSQHCQDVRYAVLLGCGGALDLVELLQPEEHIVFFVLDAHRPTDVCNVYSNGQVRLLGRQEAEQGGEGVPNFDDIFRDDDESEAEESSSDVDEADAAGASRVELLQQRAERRRTRRRERLAWEQNRDTLMFQYTQFSYYGQASAVRMMEVAWTLSKDSWEVLWWAAVGATEQLVLEKAEVAQYVLEAGALQAHAARLGHARGAEQAGLSVALEQDARLALYRHWSLEEALKYSALSWARLKLGGARGAVRLQRLLADMGLPLKQASQPHASMELGLRKEILPSLERLAEKYGLQEILYPAFCARSGHSARLCAADAVYALLGLLETPQGFQRALLALSFSEGSAELRRGIEAAKLKLRAAGRAVQGALQGHHVQSAGPFLYLLLPEEGLGGRGWLGLLARWLQRGAPGGGRPLLLGAPGPEGRTILLGVPPLTDDSTRNLFGKAFEQAALRSHSDMVADCFHSATVSILPEQLGPFLDALTTLLT